MACTCPHYVHRNAFCKHMAAVENATDDGALDAFPSEDDDNDAEPEDCDCVLVTSPAGRACKCKRVDGLFYHTPPVTEIDGGKGADAVLTGTYRSTGESSRV
jgi:SWIM zinc finger